MATKKVTPKRTTAAKSPVKTARKRTTAVKKTAVKAKKATSAITAAKNQRPRRKQVLEVTEEASPSWLTAVRAAESRKAFNVKVLDLRPVTTFADTFVICSGGNPRQIQAIADDVEKKLKEIGERPKSVEGYQNSEWVLMDYGDFVVHVFSEKARAFYDLERLWRDAPEITVPPEEAVTVG